MTEWHVRKEITRAPGVDTLTAGPGRMEETPKTPGSEYLFRSSENSPVLDPPLIKIVQSLTARILFVAIRAVYMDASFATHQDKKSHTEVMATLGTGAFYTKSTTQKINTTSSCEAELVALAKGLQQSLWTRTFLMAQGLRVPPILVYQDNQSTIKLIERGRPAAEQTRHIDIGYFWLTDLLARSVITIEYCPTLLADFFTKPLQGSLFQTMRDHVLGTTNPTVD
jgi:hypothetical protein